MTQTGYSSAESLETCTETRALCPVCKRLLPARRIVKGVSVFLERECPEHGLQRTTLSLDARRFLDRTFDIPGRRLAVYQTPAATGCPEDCGFCPDHEQHICTGLIEITRACDLACPICFANAGTAGHLELSEFRNRLNTLIEAEGGHLDVLQISGGEPLVHPLFNEIVDEAYRAGVGRILINTNGLRLLEEEFLYKSVGNRKDKVELYLQFDGFNREATARLRGHDLLDRKLALIDKCNADGIKICLAPVIFRDNLEEIPAILEKAITTHHVSGITFQRLALVGKAATSGLASVRAEEIVEALAQTPYFTPRDIIPLPCSHRSCTSLGFLFCNDKRAYSLSSFFAYKDHLDILGNRISFDQTILDYARERICACVVRKTVGKSLSAFDRVKSFFSKSQGSTLGETKIMRIVVKNFMDAETFDAERARKCCVGVSTGNGRIIPFCVNNNVYRDNA